jgi:transcription termination factor NusB
MNWSKRFRKILISGIYQHLLWTGIATPAYVPNWETIILEHSSDDETITMDALEEEYQYFLSHEREYLEILQKYIKKWNMTFDIIKAILYVFLIEKQSLAQANEAEIKRITSIYIKFAQDFAGGENPGLVHAVISNILSAKD